MAFLFGLMLSGNLKAQTPVERSETITKIGGKEYYMHKVKLGQTLWSISRVYNVSIKEIEALNPDVKKGLKEGHVLGIPVRPPKEVAPEPEPVVEELEPEPEAEPKPEPVVVEPKHEPEPEPVVVEPEPKPAVVVEEPAPEPVVVEPEPEPEPVVVDPEPEPVVVEPEPKPAVVVEEPAPEPVVVVPEPVPEPEPEPVVVDPEPEPVVQKPEPVVVKVGGSYVVKANEDLYDIAKKFGIDVADFRSVNPRLNTDVYEGMTLSVPNIVNENDYIVHKAEFNERTSSLLKRWKVDESEFRAMNVSVGSHVFVNQVVLIPIDRVVAEHEAVAEHVDEELEEPQQPVAGEPVAAEEPVAADGPVAVNDPYSVFFEPLETPECYADPANASRRYKVALLIPLYLNDVSSLEVTKENLPNLQKARSLSFLPFYEGFMMAAEKLTGEQGLRLDLTVMDVTDNVSSAERALHSIEQQHFDLIIGPFFGKSFAIIERYAKAHDILMVNPLSTRSAVIENNSNVIKLKPSKEGQIRDIAYLVRNRYPNANVFILSREKFADTLFLNRLERELNIAVNEEVSVAGDAFLRYAREESNRQELGNRLVSTITVEGQVYSTNDLQNGAVGHVVLTNPVHRYTYKSENLSSLISKLSGVRDNVVIAYGDDNVFATQVLNTLKKEADRVPITLVCAPDWTKFEKLLVENLLQMNAVYLTDNFVDYSSTEANRFVRDFRRKYAVEPQNYAVEGYDVATYFLTALMRYGSDMAECLPYFRMPLLHAQYHFERKGEGYGLENRNWSMYQYDNAAIELKPVNPFKKAEE